MFTRNAGFIDPENEQEIIKQTKVAIAGLGGDGGELAITLARMGFCEFTLADPEHFEIENTNRQAGCYSSTLGKNKASVIADIIKDLNPSAKVTVLTDGVTEENIDQFLEGAKVVADESEFTQHAIGVLIARAARKLNIPVFMGLNVGFGCIVTAFNPAGMTFEEYLGLDPGASLEEINKAEVPLDKWVPVLPEYIKTSVVEQVAKGEISAPSVSPGVAICSGILAAEIFGEVTNRQKPITAPECFWFDAIDRQVKIVTDREAEFQSSMARIVQANN